MSNRFERTRRAQSALSADAVFRLLDPSAPPGGEFSSGRQRRLVTAAMAAVALVVVLGGCSESYEVPGTTKESATGASAPTAPSKTALPPEGDFPPELARPHELQRLTQEYGAHRVATLVVKQMPVMKTRLLQQRIRAAAPGAEFQARGKGETTVAYLAPVTDLEEFAANLDLGQTRIDASKRIIVVKVDVAKLAAEASKAPSQVAGLARRGPTMPVQKPLWHNHFQKQFPPKSVLVTVYGVDPKVAAEVVGYVRQTHPTLTVSQEQLPGCPCAFVCSGGEDIKALAASLGLGTVSGIDEKQLRLNVRFDLGQVRQAAGPAVAARLDPNSLEWALKDLESGDRMRRQSAVRRLRESPPNDLRPRVVEALLKLLRDPDDFLRKEAIAGLSVWGGAQAVPPLVELLEDGNYMIRLEVIRALGRLKDERAIEPLCELLGEEPEAERALIGMGPVVESAVLARLDPTDDRQFRAACEVLAEVGTQESLAKLGPFFLRRGSSQGAQARLAVEKIRTRLQASPQALASSDPSPEQQAAMPGGKAITPGTGSAGIDVVAGAVANLKLDSLHEVRRACAMLAREKPDPNQREEVARALVDVLHRQTPTIQLAALEALAVWHTPESVPKVIEMTQHDNALVRRAAIAVLGRVKTREAIEAILDRFPHDTLAAKSALKAIGPAAEDAVLRRIDSQPFRDMSSVYHLLPEIGTTKSLKKLRQVASQRPNLENQHRVFAAHAALTWWEARLKESAQKKGRSQDASPRAQEG